MSRTRGLALLVVCCLGVVSLRDGNRRTSAATGTVTISPTSGPAGTIVQVSVNGFTPSPPTTTGSGHIYPFEILFDNQNFGYPGFTDILGYKHNYAQPFTYPITIPAWVVPGNSYPIDYQHLGSDTSVPAMFKASGPASSLHFVAGAAQTLTTGATSSPITVELRDSFGTPVRATTSGVTLSLASTSATGQFSASTSFFSITSIAVPVNTDRVTVFYRDPTAGNPTITVSRTGLTAAATSFTISPPAPVAPAAPTRLGATPLSSSAIYLSWRDSPGATGYNVFSGTSATGAFTTKVNTSPVPSPFVVTGLLSNKEHFYRVAAVNSAGSSPLSGAVSARTAGPPLAANLNLSGAQSCTSLGGDPNLPGIGFVGGACTVWALTIKPGVTLTLSNAETLINKGVITNHGTIENAGGIVYVPVGATVSNTGTINNNYGSTYINYETNNWCGATFNSIGAWSGGAPSDQCPNSTIQSATSPGQPVTFSVSPGRFFSLSAVAESSLPTSGKPSGVTFPFGFFSWRVVGIAPGATVTVRMTFASNVPSNTQYWKVINGKWTNLTALLGDNDGNQTIELTIRDGTLEDADSVPGQITDPGGLAVTVSGGSVNVYLIVGITILVLLLGLVYVFKKPPRPPRA